MADTLQLSETVRATMAESYLELQRADAEVKKMQAAFQKQIIIACDFLGIDPRLNHQINFDTGIVTPAEPLAKPTLVKEEAAS